MSLKDHYYAVHLIYIQIKYTVKPRGVLIGRITDLQNE